MAQARWTAPPRALRLFNRFNLAVQRLGVPLGPTPDAFEKGAGNVAVFRIEPR